MLDSDLAELVARAEAADHLEAWRPALQAAARVGRVMEVLERIPWAQGHPGDLLALLRALELFLGDPRYEMGGRLERVALSCDGALLAASTAEAGIRVLEVATGRTLGSLGPHWHCPYLDFDAAGTLLRGGWGGPLPPDADPARPVRVTASTTALPYRALLFHLPPGARSLGCSDDGRLWVVEWSTDAGDVAVLDLSRLAEAPPGWYPLPGSWLEVTLPPGFRAWVTHCGASGCFLLGASKPGDHTSCWYRLCDRSPRVIADLTPDPPTPVFWDPSPAGTWLAGRINREAGDLVRLYQTDSGRLVREFASEGRYEPSEWYADDLYRDSGQLHMPEAPTPVLLLEPRPARERTVSTADGATEVVLDGPVLSARRRGRPLFAPHGHPYPLREVQVAAAAGVILTRDGAGGLRLWRWSDGALLWHDAPSPRGARLAAGGRHVLRSDRDGLSWIEVPGGARRDLDLHALLPPQRRLEWADLSPDGRHLLLVHRQTGALLRREAPDRTLLVEVASGRVLHGFDHEGFGLQPISFFAGDRAFLAAQPGGACQVLALPHLEVLDTLDLSAIESPSLPVFQTWERVPLRWNSPSTDPFWGLASPERGGALVVWNRGLPLLLEPGAPLRPLAPAGQRLATGALAPDGSEAAWLLEGRVQRHRRDAAGGCDPEPMAVVPPGEGPATLLAYAPDSGALLVGQGCCLRLVPRD